ncbi:MAG: hypothetical protein WC554_16580 [Clostridia bacterium]|jgi:hypothetical protein
MFGLNLYHKKEKLKFDLKIEELNISLDRRKLEIDKEVEKYRVTKREEIQNLALRAAEDKGNLRVEIAKLEALKEIMQNDVTIYKKLLEEKNKEIAKHHEVNLKLAEQKINVYR